MARTKLTVRTGEVMPVVNGCESLSASKSYRLADCWSLWFLTSIESFDPFSLVCLKDAVANSLVLRVRLHPGLDTVKGIQDSCSSRGRCKRGGNLGRALPRSRSVAGGIAFGTLLLTRHAFENVLSRWFFKVC